MEGEEPLLNPHHAANSNNNVDGGGTTEAFRLIESEKENVEGMNGRKAGTVQRSIEYISTRG